MFSLPPGPPINMEPFGPRGMIKLTLAIGMIILSQNFPVLNFSGDSKYTFFGTFFSKKTPKNDPKI